MKKIVISAVSVIIAFTIAAIVIINNGGDSNTLYLLNWGEYIDESLFDTFKEKTGIQVVQECVTSSETMYQKISAGTTAYDVAIPGDYMITKLYNDNLLYKIDTTNYEHIKNAEFDDNLQALRKTRMSETLEYSMPYLWGAYSIVYSTRSDENEGVVETNGFKALFDKSLYNHTAKIGMYNTARWAVSAYYMSKGINPNDETFVGDNNERQSLIEGIKSANFDMWGDDALKRKVACGDLDLCFTQLGDFFDAVYLGLEEGMGGDTGKEDLSNLKYNVYVPENTAAFFDAMCIPKTSKNQEYANMFIDFMLDPENAFQNATFIGYSPALKSVQEMYKTNSSFEYYGNVTLGDLTSMYKYYLNPLANVTDISKVSMLEPKESEYLTTCEAVINQTKATVSENKALGTTLCVITLSTIILGTAAYITYVVYKKRKKNEDVRG